MFTTVPSGLDEYYTQAIAWHGQHTVATTGVSLQAMLAATESVANMLRYSPEIATRLAEAGHRYAVIADDGIGNALPEFDDEFAWNFVHASKGIPISGASENNALALPAGQNAYY